MYYDRAIKSNETTLSRKAKDLTFLVIVQSPWKELKPSYLSLVKIVNPPCQHYDTWYEFLVDQSISYLESENLDLVGRIFHWFDSTYSTKMTSMDPEQPHTFEQKSIFSKLITIIIMWHAEILLFQLEKTALFFFFLRNVIYHLNERYVFFSKLHMHIHPMSLEPTTPSPSPTPFYYYKGRKYHWDGLLTSKWKHDMHKHKTVNWLLLIILKFNMLRIHLWWKGT